MTNVSLLGHLCGILSGFACMCSCLLLKTNVYFSFSLLFENLFGHYLTIFTFSDIYGLFNFLIPGSSFYSAIESSSLLVSTLI